jgi:hypothetical protein
MTYGGGRGSDDRQMAESQLSELQNVRVLLEEARGLSRNLTYHRRARLEVRIGEALDEVDRQIRELRADRLQSNAGVLRVASSSPSPSTMVPK